MDSSTNDMSSGSPQMELRKNIGEKNNHESVFNNGQLILNDTMLLGKFIIETDKNFKRNYVHWNRNLFYLVSGCLFLSIHGLPEAQCHEESSVPESRPDSTLVKYRFFSSYFHISRPLCVC